ncbi:LysM domain/BON superfamily protein [Thalassovita gelatinovora]|uniref:LysM domain/BON superfamily protein n=1 Tax=Thalassovita gelatinovora TaxID=53501 RepID=A0A0P1F6W0_THAGE|nr:LysM peptidoglycan-binding domain-containing protein [Thalassovita gelatinovora]QIZ79220.1 LysM peptidoglycan-binding domain-containing protein [Thalassovita gelatinovora]CUH63716.1 LysM domain/BON superfamily protein [Thalassovita gelatinovora]SER02262.1 LysM domain-containing protein [Thalassovita gelatinovora]
MTKETGLASSQTLIVGAAVAIAAALAAAYGLGVFDKKAPTKPEQIVMSASAPAVEAAAEAEPTAEPKPESAAVPQGAQTEPTADPAVQEIEVAAVGEPEINTEAATHEKPVAEPVVVPQSETAHDDTVVPAVVPATPPSFDVVRVDPDGSVLVAGIALNGDKVDILVDRAALASAEPGSDGKFVAFLTLAPSDKPRLMSLLMSVGDAQIPSEDQVIIAPVPPAVATGPDAGVEAVAAVQTEASETTAEMTTTSSVVETAETVAVQPGISEAVETDMIQTGQGAEGTEPETAALTGQPEKTEPAQTEGQGIEVAMVEQAPVKGEPAPAVPAAPAVLLAGKDGVSVVQPAQSDANLTDLMLDAISYSDTGAVDLTGRGAVTMGVRAYLNNTLQASAAIGADNAWKIRLNDVAPGVYTLRLDQVDESGKTTSRVETPFKREAPEKIVAASANTAVSTTAQNTPLIRVVTVQPGHTLWAIARDNYGEGTLYVRLFEANSDLIRDPDLIYPGQVFDIPRD